MTFLAAMLLALAVWLWLPPSDGRRLRSLFGSTRQPRSSSPLLVPMALVVFGLGMSLMLGSLLGVGLGIAAAIAFPRVMSRLDGRSERARVAQLHRQLPQVADLLAATLASGAPVGRAVQVVARAVDAPISEVLTTVSSALDLGATVEQAWQLADSDGVMRDLSMGFERSARSGAPMSDVLSGIASDLRRRHRQSVEVDARVAGVKAIAPLAACFLPAFMLVGAVPIVASFATGLFSS